MEARLKQKEYAIVHAVSQAQQEHTLRHWTLIRSSLEQKEWLSEADKMIVKSISLTNNALIVAGLFLVGIPLIKLKGRKHALVGGLIGSLITRRYKLQERSAVMEEIVSKYWQELGSD
jgi:hypothetical protein